MVSQLNPSPDLCPTRGDEFAPLPSQGKGRGLGYFIRSAGGLALQRTHPFLSCYGASRSIAEILRFAQNDRIKMA